MSHREEQQIEARRTWTAPAVRRLAAGSAEDGADNTADGGQPS
jgi:hypothetical protein